jgi:tetratricopeptide (TPR) repeat protein
MAEANWTGDALARAINMAGAEAGVTLRYGRSSVAHWLSGVCPRSPVPEFVAEVFSRRLGRPVPVAATGFIRSGGSGPAMPQVRWWEMDVASRLLVQSHVGVGEAIPLQGRGYRLGDLAVPGWDAVAGTRPGRSWAAEPVAKVERWHVRSATGLVQVFSDADFAFGGGHSRLALAGYLAATIAPWLRATATPVVRRELLVTASRLTYLCGFMHFDDELHGAAQHYYLTTLRLAAEAGDATAYAVTLCALSGQARILGHHRQAVDLAEAAVRAVSGATGAQTSAFLFAQLAVAEATDGDRREAIRHLLTAERHLDRVRDEPVPIGGCHAASLAHQQAAVRARLGDRDGAIQALTVSLRHRPAGERRSRAVTLARLAELQLDAGDLEAACDAWRRFLQDYPHLSSRRVGRALMSMRARLQPIQNNSAVIALGRTR